MAEKRIVARVAHKKSNKMVNADEKVDFNRVDHVFTHCGRFNLDEVFAFGWLRYIGIEQMPVRVNRLPLSSSPAKDIIINIGGGEYDTLRPSKKNKKRSDGAPYGVFGLIVRDTWHEIFDTEKEYDMFDKFFIRRVELSGKPNSGEPKLAYDMFGMFNPNWDEPESSVKERLDQAIEISTDIIDRQVRYTKSIAKASAMADTLRESESIQNGVVFMDVFCPLAREFEPDDSVQWLGYPSKRGGYAVRAINYDGTRIPKAEIPEEFRGDLLDDMMYCHPNGTLVDFKSKEACMEFFQEHHDDIVFNDRPVETEE